ncbi:MAG: hypothetical protein ACI85I_002593 [Arenicella sp.]|jgi:hypothetical protein
MKIQNFLMLVLLLIFTSCNSKKKEVINEVNQLMVAESENSKDNKEEDVKTENDETASDLKSFKFCDKTAYVTKSTKAEFEKLSSQSYSLDETKNLEKEKDLVARIGDSLIFKLANEKMTYLVNNVGEGVEDEYIKFQFLGNLQHSRQMVLNISFFEGGEYWMVDSSSGDTTRVFGYPVVSSDKTMMLVGSAGLEGGYIFNGFELYNNSSPLTKICSIELYNWGPEEIRWIDNSSIIAKSTVFDKNAESLFITEYLKVSWQ